MRRSSLLILAPWLIAGVTSCAKAQAQAQDPPARVGRVSMVQGNVSLYPVGDTTWTDASVNYPLTSGDAIWADTSARAEIEMGPSVLRLDSQTSLVFGEISDTVTQMRIDQGSIDVRLRQLGDHDVYEIDTPDGVISLDTVGDYRIDVTPDGKRATLTVRSGAADITSGNQSTQVAENESAVLTNPDQPAVLAAAIPVDDWEQWADARAASDADVQATNYVSPDMVGYEDLDNNGTWQVDATYGNVWIPRSVPQGWAPYRFGHWQSVKPWGWTWIDDEPWGFAPFHYGRWAYVTGRWGWVPGARDVQPVYAPALVAFVSGPQWSVGVTAGGPGVGWVPLGPGEPYVPDYHVSQNYLRRVNVNNVNATEFDPARINIDRIRYANRDAPNGVTVVPRDVFAQARPVGRATLPVRPNQIAAARPNSAPMAGGQRITAPSRPMPVAHDHDQRASHPPALANPRAEPPRPAQWHPRPAAVRPAPDNHPQAEQPGRNTAPSVHEERPSMRPVPPEQPTAPSRTPRPAGPPSRRPTPEPAQPPVMPQPPTGSSSPARGHAPDSARRRAPPQRPEAPPSPRPEPQPATPPVTPSPSPERHAEPQRDRGSDTARRPAPRPARPPQTPPPPSPVDHRPVKPAKPHPSPERPDSTGHHGPPAATG